MSEPHNPVDKLQQLYADLEELKKTTVNHDHKAYLKACELQLQTLAQLNYVVDQMVVALNKAELQKVILDVIEKVAPGTKAEILKRLHELKNNGDEPPAAGVLA